MTFIESEVPEAWVVGFEFKPRLCRSRNTRPIRCMHVRRAGRTELVAALWINDVFDPYPDTFPETV